MVHTLPCIDVSTLSTLPSFSLDPSSDITAYLLKVEVLWQPELSQEFGAALEPLWPLGLVTIPPSQFMPRS
jgi:hypothetical protein